MTDPKSPENQLLPPVSALPGIPGALLHSGLIFAPLRPGEVGSVDHYRLLSVLGEGGMGIVFRALDARDGATVAIKMLRPELASQPALVHRFLKEARHMQRLKHPAILPVLHVSENPAAPYFVMPLMQRGSLLQHLSADRPLPEEECVAIARQVASALAHAHAKGVIHRDLKPGNVLLDASGNAFLADFGLARTVFNDSLVNPERGEPGEGTAHYMSPQLARGEAEDTRCDIYALGALLYEMLTGRPPYEGQSVAHILQRIRNAPPEPIARLRGGLSSGLARVVEGAMAREHRDRYASMADVVADLERLEKGQTPVGPRTPFGLRRWVRTRSRQLVSAGCVLATVLGAVVGYDWLAPGYALRAAREFSLPEVETWANARVGDWDGDGESDIVRVQGDKLLVVSGDGQRYKPLALEKPNEKGFNLGRLEDMDGDGLEEALLCWNQGTNAHLGAFNQMAWPIRDFIFGGSLNVHSEWGTNCTGIHPLRLADLDGNGRNELLASVTSTWARRPRGLCCFDVETAQLQWFFETANYVLDVALCDLEGDGRQEIVAGGNSPGNGCRLEDGTDDDHAYMYVLSCNGVLRWRQELAGVFAGVWPLPSLGRDRPAVAWVTAGHAYSLQRGESDTGRILAFDPQGALLQEWDCKNELTSVLAADLNGDKTGEILAADRLGMLHVLDGHLREIQRTQLVKSQFDEVWVQLFEVAKPANHTSPWILLGSSQLERFGEPYPGNNRREFDKILYHDNRLMVLDNHLKVVTSFLVREKWSIFQPHDFGAKWLPSRPGQSPQILVLSDRLQWLSLEKERRPLFQAHRGGL